MGQELCHIPCLEHSRCLLGIYCCCSVAKSCPTLWKPHRLQQIKPSCLSFTVSQSLLKWTQMPIESVMLSNHLILCGPFLFLPQSFPTSGSFPMSQLFTSGGQNIGASASVLAANIQGWVPLCLTGLISLQSNKAFSKY